MQQRKHAQRVMQQLVLCFLLQHLIQLTVPKDHTERLVVTFV
jgi:hypothetical protein